jgi:hypothetical protein
LVPAGGWLHPLCLVEAIGQRFERQVLATDPALQPSDLLGIGPAADDGTAPPPVPCPRPRVVILPDLGMTRRQGLGRQPTDEQSGNQADGKKQEIRRHARWLATARLIIAAGSVGESAGKDRKLHGLRVAGFMFGTTTTMAIGEGNGACSHPGALSPSLSLHPSPWHV